MREWLSMPIDPKRETPCRFGRVYSCDACRFGAVWPRPRPDEVGEFYRLESYYTHGRSHLAGAGARTFFDRLRQHLAWRVDLSRYISPEMAEQLLGPTGREVCDVGCGCGELAARMQAHGFRVVGVDLDPRAAAAAAARGVEIYEGSAEQLPEAVRGRRFDLVIMSHVLEHCLDPLRALANAGSLLRGGGFLVCEVPNNGCAGAERSGVTWEPLDVPRHLNFFASRNLAAACGRAGLRPETHYYCGYYRQFTNEWINTERRIGEAVERSGQPAVPPPVKNSRARAWALLAATAFARPPRKYDAVGVIARRP
jgi:2-polyprenyl-3-methyl-5-hydroxy-6-metoxy-1,4-benzoquinol methylase